MNNKTSFRLTVIIGVFLMALGCIFWPVTGLFDSSKSFSQKVNLRPGIDIAGGVKLVYKIILPAGQAYKPELAQEMATALKRRVDPDGVKNLVWRPQPPDELVIEMPLSSQSDEIKVIREKYAAAKGELDATNVNLDDVEALVGDGGGADLDLGTMGGATSAPATGASTAASTGPVTAAGMKGAVGTTGPSTRADSDEVRALLGGWSSKMPWVDDSARFYGQLDALGAAATLDPGVVDEINDLAQDSELVKARLRDYAMVSGQLALERQRAAALKAKEPAAKGLALTALQNEEFDADDSIIAEEPLQAALLGWVAGTNLTSKELEQKIEAGADSIAKAKKDEDTAKVTEDTDELDLAKKEMVGRKTDSARRTAAISGFLAQHDQYDAVKNAAEDSEDLKEQLRGSGVLEFHILLEAADKDNEARINQMVEGLAKNGPENPDEKDMRWYEADHPEEFAGRQNENVVKGYLGKVYVLCWTKSGKQLVQQSEDPNTPKWSLVKSAPTVDQNTGQTEVEFDFDKEGGELFSTLTGQNIKKALGIVLDGKIISAPNIQSEIGDRGTITGQRTEKDRNYLISTLNAGSLPAELAAEPIQEKTVSPAVGADNLKAGLLSCVIGLIVVGIFMVIYYHLSGVVAVFALFLNMLVILGVLAAFKATFTLPGIAALVLTVGTSVDANVLVFERLREEQHRGLSLRMALHNGYDRAFSAILDSNVITIIVSVVLYEFGTEEVKGFGLTLLIGILTSLFSALFVTRTIFDIWIERFGLNRLGSLPLSFPWWDRMLKPKIDWMGKAWIFYLLSAVIIASGLYAYLSRGREMYDIEFVAGTSVDFQLKPGHAMPNSADVQKRLEAPGFEKTLPTPQAVKMDTEGLQYEVVTPNDDPKVVTRAVEEAMAGDILVDPAIKYSDSDLSADDTSKALVFAGKQGTLYAPVTRDLQAAMGLGFRPKTAVEKRGGVAFHLTNLTPAVSARDVRERIERAKAGAKDFHGEVTVDSPGKDDEAASSELLVTFYDPDLQYDKNAQDWLNKLVKPGWSLMGGALARQSALQNVTTFSPQVAQDVKNDALMALGISIGLVMIYIWMRFGNLKYGSATVFAMLHDVAVTIGAIGLSHLLVEHLPWVQTVFLLQPFRMNLTLVAAVLTVMAYSMIDTIVVFDRIRENRGKFGHLSRGLINDSINQTLSRTMLTCGVTLSTIFIMYVFGGSAIHGFTFALLGGILVGTYSSIAIAAPLLLLGKDVIKTEEKAPAGQLQRAGG